MASDDSDEDVLTSRFDVTLGSESEKTHFMGASRGENIFSNRPSGRVFESKMISSPLPQFEKTSGNIKSKIKTHPFSRKDRLKTSVYPETGFSSLRTSESDDYGQAKLEESGFVSDCTALRHWYMDEFPGLSHRRSMETQRGWRHQHMHEFLRPSRPSFRDTHTDYLLSEFSSLHTSKSDDDGQAKMEESSFVPHHIGWGHQYMDEFPGPSRAPRRVSRRTQTDELILSSSIKVFQNKLIYKAGNGITIFEGERFGSHKIAVKFFPCSERTMTKARSLELEDFLNTVRVYDRGIHSTELGNSIFIAMELCSRETLYDYINNFEYFDHELALIHSEQIICGVLHIHRAGIAHKGLKPHNVLFDSDIGHDKIKISPFAVNEYESGETFSALGYNAPEVIRHEIPKDEKKCDVFFLGVLLFFILSNGKHSYGELPWQRDYNIASGAEPDLSIILLPHGKLRDDIIDLIRKMLQHDPESRPTAEALCLLWPIDIVAPFSRQQLVPSARIAASSIKGSEGDSLSNEALGQLGAYYGGSVDRIMLSQTVRKKSQSFEDSGSSVEYEAQRAGSQRMGSETKDLGGSDDDKLKIKLGELSMDRTSKQAEMATSIYSTDIEERIKQKLLSPSAAVENIGPEGGDIELFGCILSLPPRAHQTRRPAKITVRSSYTDAPEGYVVASPELNCDTFGVPFDGLATITLPLHAIPADGQVQIITKQDGDSDWEILDVHPTLVGRKVTFQVSHFSPFKVILSYIRCWFSTYASHYVAFKASTSELRGLTSVDDERVKNICIETLEKEGFKLWSHIPDMIVLSGLEEVSYKYNCLSPEESRLKPDIEVLTRKDLVPHKMNSFKLLPRPGQHIDVVDIECSRTTVDRTTTSVFALEWSTPEVEGGGQELGAAGFAPVAGGPAVGNPVGMVEPIAGAHVLQLHQGQKEPRGNVEFRISTREFYELHRHALDVYQVDHNNTKGSVLILNNEFQGEEIRRAGSEVDVQNLEELWSGMGFNVQKERNLSAVGMREACRDFAVNRRDASVLILIIMSHGGKKNGEEFIIGEDGVRVPSDELISPFTSRNSRHLRRIPKVFMFQACRGAQCDNIQQDANQEVQAIQARHPDRADMLIVYPSQSGAVSYRNPTHGSVLMNAVVNVFKRDAHDTHILDLLTTVNSEVAPEGGRLHSVQASNLVSFLRKKLFLFPGW